MVLAPHGRLIVVLIVIVLLAVAFTVVILYGDDYIRPSASEDLDVPPPGGPDSNEPKGDT